MNITHLKYAIEVEKTGSITKAAEHLYMGQPNLSKSIKELEASIGITLFKRTAKGIIPTKKGAEFLSYAKNVLMQIDALESYYKPSSTKKVDFRISVPRASYITYAFTHFINDLEMKGTATIDFKETNSMEAIENILENGFNLGIIRYATQYEKYFLHLLNEKEFKYETLWTFEYLVLMSKEHPLAYSENITLQDLEDYIEVIHGDLVVPTLSSIEIKKSNWAETSSKQIYVYERGSQFDLLSEVPTSYMWVSPVPSILLERYGLVQRKCEVNDNVNKDVLIYPKRYRLNGLDRQFINQLERIKEEMIHGVKG
ncbi:LysR family transcriptional regulator [Niameybacter massiliensis]|uniref:LysR family transcriptional regulator n=1 Tax=Holtiella tumoricola TaxID=3018743 RepID=A0AA42DPL7_9FIRM|nr:LysR family transcriptional regulator [Holtiella tumoricola]MDA3732810.1 LysR family transcriptional regulator [Holtiella tumoricola]